MNRLRIAIVSPLISTLGNLEFYQSQQINLALQLEKLGAAVDIYTATPVSARPRDYRLTSNVKVCNLSFVSPWIARRINQPIMLGLIRRLRSGQYDIIQSSEDCLLSTFASAIASLFTRSRLIVYQGIYDYSIQPTLRYFMKIYDLTAGVVIRRCYHIAVCKTQKASEFLHKKGYTRTLVIPVGVDTDLFYPEKQRPPDGRLELLAVGNLIPLKNYSLMVNVLEHLVRLQIGVRLTVIGSGPEKDHILRMVRDKGLSNYFRLLQNIPNLQMRHYYTHSDLLLLLSHTEIFGMVILESMACGCPILATPTAGAADVIRPGLNGFFVSSLKAKAIAFQIREIWSNRHALANVRAEGIRFAAEQYSWSRIAGAYWNLYNCEI